MGYETSFDIEVDGAEPADVALALDEISGYDFEYSASSLYPSMGRCKWYDYEKDMLEASRQFPGALFTVRGEGEEQPDLWVHYFKNGKHVRHEARITYPEFNEGDLA